MKLWQISLLLLALLLLTLSAQADDPPPLELRISTDKEMVRIYETITITIELRNVSNREVDIPDPRKYGFYLGHDYLHDINPQPHLEAYFIGGGWGTFPIKPFRLKPGEIVAVKETFTPIHGPNTLKFTCQYSNTYKSYSALFDKPVPGTRRSSSDNSKFENPFVGKLQSNEVTVEVTGDIDPKADERFQLLQSNILSNANDEEQAKEIQNWSKLKCGYFDDEIWELSFASSLSDKTRKRLWRYLLANLTSGLGYRGIDSFLAHAGELLKEPDIREDMIAVLKKLATDDTLWIGKHQLSYYIEEHTKREAQEILSRLGVEWREEELDNMHAPNDRNKQRDSETTGDTTTPDTAAKKLSRKHHAGVEKSDIKKASQPVSEKKEQSSWTRYLRYLLVVLCVLLLIIVIERKHGL